MGVTTAKDEANEMQQVVVLSFIKHMRARESESYDSVVESL
jgi:hypothetical protein